MRVAVDVSQTCVSRAGCAWLADTFAKELADKLGRCNVLLYHHFGKWINHNTSSGTRIDGVQSPFIDVTPNQAKRFWEDIEAGNVPLPGNPDIVHSFSFMAPSTPQAKLVYTIHDLCFWTHPELTTETNRLLCQSELLFALSRASAFNFVSNQSLQDFKNLLPSQILSDSRPLLITEPSIRESLLADISEPLLKGIEPWLHIGTIEPRKGINHLLEEYKKYHTLSEIRRPLVLIGNQGWKSEEIHLQICELSKTLPIIYFGYLDEKQLASHLNHCFGLISLSKYEGFGLPVLEAASLGKPVVCTNPPSFEPYYTAIEYYRKDLPPHLRMLELESDRELRETVSKKSLEIANSRQSNWIQKSISLYQSLIKER